MNALAALLARLRRPAPTPTPTVTMADLNRARPSPDSVVIPAYLRRPGRSTHS